MRGEPPLTMIAGGDGIAAQVVGDQFPRTGGRQVRTGQGAGHQDASLGQGQDGQKGPPFTNWQRSSSKNSSARKT